MQADTSKQIILIAAMEAKGGPVAALAEKVGLHERSVYRYFADLRQNYGMEIELQSGSYHVVNWGAFRKVWFHELNRAKQ